MTINSVVHETWAEGQECVETVGQLLEALSEYHGRDVLDETYVVERVAERLSDDSTAYSVRIRRADRV